MTTPLTQLQAHVRYRLGSRVAYAGAGRCDELTVLVVRHWPHRMLEEATVVGRNSRLVVDALRLCRAQVQERWELSNGIGPLWDLVLAGTVDAVGEVILELWWADAGWRDALHRLSLAGDRQ